MLRDETLSLYTGISTDVERRLQEHRHKGCCGAKYTRAKKRLDLVYCCELGSRSLASRAEYRLKKLPKGQKEAIVAGGYDRTTLLAFLGLALETSNA
ncbi:MAG: GIY-YIG nuclease family protein [Desulfocapsaceae bacterium]|jgi:putative endonuclease|nr:GIY-YIG nuclease family protein [Desulfocapsaceae bacterium]